ncbi:MAG: ATP-dependent DNA helicase RecG [Micromonosporaceae bacterium]
MATLDSPLKTVLGAKTAKALSRGLQLETVEDLLYHFPRRYAERGEHTDIGSLQVGEHVTVMGQVRRVSTRRMRQRRGSLLEVHVGESGTNRVLTLTFFNQAWRERELSVGRWGLFAGKVTEFRGKRQLNQPDYQLLADTSLDADQAAEELEEFAGALIPVYPATSSTPTWTIARCVRVALDTLQPPPDPLEGLNAGARLVGLAQALHDIHRPTSRQALGAARTRLKWDEAFALQVTLVQRKVAAAQFPATPRPLRTDGLVAAFDQRLPFTLTDGQRAVGKQIAEDLAQSHPMHRLLQGEVGSGKTLVALRAMLQVVDSGGQAALLAPTEVLANQHFRSVCEMLGPMGQAGQLGAAEEAAAVALLTGGQPAAVRRQALAKVASGEAGLVVGTHALLYEGVEFADLGLVVVDEQHRFGVEQREALRAKANEARRPHTLVMTATPIPRTVAMTVYGDLETSALTELPAGRSPISTHVVPAADKPHFMERAWRRLREEVAAGHQAYVVCPRIGDGESGADRAGDGEFSNGPTDGGPNDNAGELGPADTELDVEPDDQGGEGDGGQRRRPPLAVLDVAPMLVGGRRNLADPTGDASPTPEDVSAPLQGLRVAVLHGRLPAEEKDAVMREFAAGRLDALVATTVIEVGVDVPNATMMVIMDADRFGVSQLHQLRGRVGRGAHPGLCLLVSEAQEGAPARERLDAVASTLDGFRLAELDLEQRREGDVLGESQSGRRTQVRLLSLLRDAELIREARAEAIDLVAADPQLHKHPALADAVATLVSDERAEYLEKG